jgi:hypothetical protein
MVNYNNMINSGMPPTRPEANMLQNLPIILFCTSFLNSPIIPTRTAYYSHIMPE